MKVTAKPDFSTGRLWAGALLLALAGSAVAQTPAPQPPRVVVDLKDVQLTTTDVQASLRGMPEAQRRATQATADGMGALANDLFLRRALAHKARADGLGSDALDQAALAQAADRVLSDLLLARIDAVNALSDEQALTKARELYDADPKRFEQPEQVRARHILIGPANDEQARQKAAEVLALAQAPGADFAALARQHSQDLGSARDGGDLGLFSRDKMVPAFTQAAFALQAGELSPVVATPFGFHIIRVEERKPAGPRAFDDVKAPLMAQARQNALLEGRRKEVDAVLKDARYHTEVLESLVVRPPGGATR